MLRRNAGAHRRRQTTPLAHLCSSTEHWHALVFPYESSILLPNNRARKLFCQTSRVNRDRSCSTPNNHVTGAVPNTDAWTRTTRQRRTRCVRGEWYLLVTRDPFSYTLPVRPNPPIVSAPHRHFPGDPSIILVGLKATQNRSYLIGLTR